MREGRERKKRGREVGKGKGKRGEEGREREGKGQGPQVTVEPGPLRALLRHCLHTLLTLHISLSYHYHCLDTMKTK